MLVDSYAHWAERSTGHILLRPLESPWDTTKIHWWMRRSPDGTYWMHNSSCSLFDIRSPTVEMISSRLASIEASEQLIVTLSSDHRLCVELPRYHLRFTLQGNSLLSENHPGFTVDNLKTIGTFVGLRNRLVLIPPSNKLYTRRRLIVPRGKFHIVHTQDHVEVTIKTDGFKRVYYHEYEVDETLGRLVDNGDILSRFTKIYIHAITGFCLPDPLSGLTGTEMAIEELRSSSCLSFQKLQDIELRMLCKIRAIAPRREWYPSHLQTMQTIHWHPQLSFLSQHDDFVFYSSNILQHAERMVSGGQSPQQFNFTPDVRLQNRAAFRRGWCYTISLQRFPLPKDNQYSSGDRGDGAGCNCASESEVASLAAIILHPRNYVDPTQNLWAILEEWMTLNDKRKVAMEYSQEWCKPKWRQMWLTLCRQLRGIRTSSLLFPLATAMYTSPEDRQLMHTLLAFATDESLWNYNLPVSPGVPNSTAYDLSKGTKPDRAALRKILHEAADFEESPFYDAAKWDSYNLEQQRLALAHFKEELELQVQDAVARLIAQWPCENPQTPRRSNGSSWIFGLQEVMDKIRGCFASWYRNSVLYQHIAEVQPILTAISLRSTRLSSLPYNVRLSEQAPHQKGLETGTVSLLSLIGQRTPPTLPPPPSQISGIFTMASRIPHTSTDLEPELTGLFTLFQNSRDCLLQKYGEQLDASRQAMARQPIPTLSEPPTESECKDHVIACESHFNKTLSIILNALQPLKAQEQTLAADLWPRLTLRTILSLLSHITRGCLSELWRDTLMRLADSLLIVQRARRLHTLTIAGDKLSLERELQNVVPEDECHAEWQLVQVLSIYPTTHIVHNPSFSAID